jgi:hypothetical protein
MSGGTFDYIQYRFTDIVESIKDEIENSGREKTREEMKHEYRDPDWYNRYPEDKFHSEYMPVTLKEFQNAIDAIKLAQIYIQRVDYLLAGDDGEESFHRRLDAELKEFRDVGKIL